MRRFDGCIPLRHALGYGRQGKWPWTPLSERDLHIVVDPLNVGLHTLHKLFIPQVDLPF